MGVLDEVGAASSAKPKPASGDERLEKWVKDKFLAYLKGQKGDVHYYMPQQNGRGVIGVPDFVLCVRGRYVTVETKKPGYRPSDVRPSQIEFAKAIEAAGGRALITDDPTEAIRLVEEVLHEEGANG